MNADLLRSILSYEPETGIFRWLVRRGNTKIGKVAGTPDRDGYIIIRYAGIGYKAHRLAWLYAHGGWPSETLDHFDEIKSNNRIDNLREADSVTQNANITPANANTSSGLRGVSWFSQYQKWKASFRFMGNRIFVGHYDDKHEAYRACEARREKELKAASIVAGRFSGEFQQ